MRLALGSLLVLLATTSAAASRAATLPIFDLRSDEIFNLVYQLDCLPDGESCPFHGLWQRRLGWSREDDEAQSRRLQVRARYTGSITIDADVDDAPFMLDAPRVIELKKKLLIAAAGARSIAEYRDRLTLVVSAADAARIAAETERFLPRFRRYFRETRGPLADLSMAVRRFLNDSRVRRVVAQAMTFYDVPAPYAGQIVVQLVPLPADWSGGTRGEQIEHLSTIEVGGSSAKDEPGALPEKIGVIALHELFHSFYAAAPGARARALAAAFADVEDSGAAAAYGLLNEGLATALSMVGWRAYLSPKSFQAYVDSNRPWYQDPAIDMAGRALLPVVDATLARGGTLYDPQFVPGYVQALRAHAGAALDRPALKLRTLLMAGEDQELRPAMQLISARAASGFAMAAIPLDTPQVRAAWEAHAEQSGVLLVRGSSLEKLRPFERLLGRGVVERLTVLQKQHGAFVHSVRRARHGVFYLLVADEGGQMRALAELLMSAEAPFELLTLPPGPAAGARGTSK